ncbi:serine/threonine protein kinase, partial [Frankia sp. AiPs1]|nr:serine/threonine protein kinase [Frankia sp. AiPs1]
PTTTAPRGPSGRVEPSSSTCSEPDVRRVLWWLGADRRCVPVVFGQPERAARGQAGNQPEKTPHSQRARTSGHVAGGGRG